MLTNKKMNTITQTNFNFPNQTDLYKGKVRDVYTIDNDKLVMIASDRISAFDHVLPKGIPYKGQVLNQIASKFLDATSDILPNWKEASPDPSVTVGKRCEPFKVEMVIRGYLTKTFSIGSFNIDSFTTSFGIISTFCSKKIKEHLQ